MAPTQKRPLPIIRVFVSSTFSDLKHERNALHAQVWPELERYCQQRGFTFQAIDLRWGVPAEAGLDHRTMRICFEELRRSQETSPAPNFLILLGNRYGWRPLPEVISVAEFQQLETAASDVATAAANDPTKDVRLRRASEVLQQWYLLDENAKPFGEENPAGEYVLRSRKNLLGGVDYGNQPDATGKLRDTAAWVDAQFVLWSIVNLAFPAADLAARFQTLHETSPGTVPSSVRFQASATEQEIWQGALQVEHADRHVIAAVREIVDLDAFSDSTSKHAPTPTELASVEKGLCTTSDLTETAFGVVQKPKNHRDKLGGVRINFPGAAYVDLKDDGTPDGDARQALADLKAELERRLSSSPIIRSTCQWAIDQDNNPTGDITTSHLDDFCREIRDRFKSIIIEQINAYWDCDLSADDATLAQVRGSQQELDLECADHLRFAGERAPEKTFVGREPELQRIRDYLHSETNQPFVVHGPSGSGKTALLGKIIQEVTPPRSADGTREKTGPIVLTRFIGTTPESSNLRSLLSSLCRELRQPLPVTETREMPGGKTETVILPLPSDLYELIDEFYSQLDKATATRPVFVFFDALDQLDAADKGRSVFWIRSPLSSTTDAVCHARMVVSCLSPSDEFPDDSEACEPFRELNLRKLLGSHELGAFDENDARQLFARWLHGAGRCVSKPQQDVIWSAMQKSSACRQPLFLKVVFEEAKLWRSYDAEVLLNEPETSNDYVGVLLKQLFDRLSLEVNHGKLLVERALGYIAAARRGLSETEILEVLFADTDYKKQLEEASHRNNHQLPTDPKRIPIAIWSRLRSDLASYLTERSAPGGNVLTLYHRQVAEWIKARFVEKSDWNPHGRLATFFANQDNFLESHEDKLANARRLTHTPQPANIRKVDELPWQRLHEGQWDELVSLLTDLHFVEAKCSALLVFDLIEDYRETLAALPENNARQQEQQQREVRLARWSDELTRYSQAWTEHREQVARRQTVPPTEPPLPEPPVSCRTWTDAEVARESRRITETPTRLDRLIALAEFVGAECHPLLQFGEHKGFIQQHAWNYAPRGPVHDAAAEILIGCHSPKLLRRWPRDAVYNPMPALLSTLTGHTGIVWNVSLTADGKRAVSGSEDNTLRVWNIESGQCQHILAGHNAAVSCVCVTTDGRRAVSGSLDHSLRLWNLENGQCLRTLRCWPEVFTVCVMADGRRAVSGNKDATLVLWDLESGQSLHTLKGHKHWITSVTMTPDGRRAISGSADNTLRLWDLDTGQCLQTLEGHTADVFSVSMTPDGRRAVSGSLDHSVRVWNLESGTCTCTLTGHTSEVWSVAVTADGRRAVSASLDNTLQVWDLLNGRCRRMLSVDTHRIRSISASSDGRLALSGSADHSVRVWNLESGQCVPVQTGHTGEVLSISTAITRQSAVSGSVDKTLRVWDPDSGQCLHKLEGHSDSIRSVSVSADGRRAVSGSKDKTLRMWDIDSGQCLRTLIGHTDDVCSVSLTPDGLNAVSGGEDETLRVWDLDSGECLHTLGGDGGSIWSVSVTADGRRALSGSWHTILQVWDIVRGQLLREVIACPTHLIKCVIVSADGRRALSGGWDGEVRHLDLESGDCLRTLKGHTGWVLCASVTPDGRHAISGGMDRTLRVWDLESGQCLCVYSGTAPISAVSIDSPRNRICFGTSSSTVLFLDVQGIEITRTCIPNISDENHEQLLRRSLESIRREKGDYHAETLAHLNALFSHFLNLGNFDSARQIDHELEKVESWLSARNASDNQ